MLENMYNTNDNIIFTSDYNDALLCAEGYYDTQNLLSDVWGNYDEYSSAICESV